MQNTIFLAQFWGWLLIILGLLFFFKRNGYLAKMIGLSEDKEFTLLSGYLAIVIGLATVLLHNLWVNDFRVTITVLGWLTLAKGILRIALPSVSHGVIRIIKSNVIFFRAILLVMVIIGFMLIRMS
ncbi:MAG: hypothetical protein AAB381_00645 [Patescibacteria group bacterium]